MKWSRNTVFGFMAYGAAVFVSVCLADVTPPGEWTPKFYEGLEAMGEVSFPVDGDETRSPCVELRHVGGAKKFGVEKPVRSALAGVVKWTVSADVRCVAGGEAGVSMEFFSADGKSLDVREGEPFRNACWTTRSWTFVSPAAAASASVHLLSLAGGSVRFANVRISSERGKAPEEMPFEARVLPVKWNGDWNDGRAEFTSFADAPLPFAINVKGDRSRLKAPAILLDVPDSLALADAFTEHPDHIGRENPVSESVHARNGVAYRLMRFERLRLFDIMKTSYAFERKLAVVLEPKPGAAFADRAFKVFWRLADGEWAAKEQAFDIRFLPLPENLREPKSFPVFSWRSSDRQFSDDGVFNRVAAAYEAAGLTTFVRPEPTSRRGLEQIALLERRPRKWTFVKTFPDLWNTMFLGRDSPAFAALGVRLAQWKDGRKTDLLCPDYFVNDPKFDVYFRERIRTGLKSLGIRGGDWVAFDFEPWRSEQFCVCERCRAAYSAANGLEKPIPADKIRSYRDSWAKFRCQQTEASVAKFCRIVREYDPGIRIADYDYVNTYGDPDVEKRFYRDCAKNAALNEKWFDIHLCSYYHVLDVEAFKAMRNNVRHLKKDYVPLGGIDGYGGYLRAGEVRTPRQLAQFALAAFVNGCPAIGFFEGFHYDGLQMLALMQARDRIASVEKFPWGRVDGTLVATAASDKFVFASSAADGEEAIALFNYEPGRSVMAKVTGAKGGEAICPVTGRTFSADVAPLGGLTVEIPPESVRLVVMRNRR